MIYCKILTLSRLLEKILRAYMMKDELQSHIEQKGRESIAGLKGDTVATDFVENLVSVHKKYR